MSFGFGLGDVIAITQLAWKTVEEAYRACGQHNELFREMYSLHKVLIGVCGVLTKPTPAPPFVNNEGNENRIQELLDILDSCSSTLRVLNKVLAMYNALDEDKKRSTKLWRKIRFANGEMRDLASTRLDLTTHTSAINLVLNLLSLGSQGVFEKQLDELGGELSGIRKSVDTIVVGLTTQVTEGSVFTALYEDEDNDYWISLRRGLIERGYSSGEMSKHRRLIQDYVKELGERGVLDDNSHGNNGKVNYQEQALLSLRLGRPNLREDSISSVRRGRDLAKDVDQSTAKITVEVSNQTDWFGKEEIRKRKASQTMFNTFQSVNEERFESARSNEANEAQPPSPTSSSNYGFKPASPPASAVGIFEASANNTRYEEGKSIILQGGYGREGGYHLGVYETSEVVSIDIYAPSGFSERFSASLFSSDPSLGLTTDMKAAGDLEGVEHILAEPFLSNSVFVPAYVAAIESIGVDRFRSNLSRLLDRYAVDLLKEAKSWLEVNTACVMKAHVTSVTTVISDISSGMTLANRAIEDSAAESIEFLRKERKGHLQQIATMIVDVADLGTYDPEEVEVADEDIMLHLKEAKHFMTSSNAFRRFQEELRIFVFPVMSSYIRTIIRSSSKPVPENGSIHVRCQAQWNMLEFCEKELDGYTDILPLLTITGSSMNAQAISCERYTRETWGAAGVELLNGLVFGLGTKSCDAFLAEGRHMHIDFHAKSQEHPETASILLTGNLDQIVEMLEQLSWLAATFRVSAEGLLTSSYAYFKEISAKYKFDWEPEFELSLVSPRYHPIGAVSDEKPEQSNCWTPLFSAGVLAQGYRIRQRPEAAFGLEIDFPVLAVLARLDGPMNYEEGIMFSGKSSMLFPSRLLEAGTGAIQWHLVGVDDAVCMVDILEKSNWVQSRDLEQLVTSRSFLGYCKYAQVLAGTKGLLDKSTVSESCIRRSTSTLEVRPEVSISTGFTAKGIWNATLATKVVLTKGLRAQISGDEMDFRDRLHRTVQPPVLVFDTSTQSAWLIPEISLILHIVHEYLKQDWVQTPRGPGVILPYAEVASDGGNAAFHAIVEHGHEELWKRQEDGKSKRFMDVISDYVKLFETIRKEVNMKKAAAGKKFRQPRLLGWDFIDILAKDHLFYERELSTDMGPRMAWWDIALNTDTLVVFGSNFGQLIRPDPERSLVCQSWSPVPANSSLLTASARCMMYLARKCDVRDTSYRRVAEGLEWHTPKGSHLYGEVCNGTHCEKCIFIQELRSTSKMPWHRSGKNTAAAEAIDLDGALIIGSVNYYKSLKRHNQYPERRNTPKCLSESKIATASGVVSQSSPTLPVLEVGGFETKTSKSVSQQSQLTTGRTEIQFSSYQHLLYSSDFGHSAASPPTLYLRGEQNSVQDQAQSA